MVSHTVRFNLYLETYFYLATDFCWLSGGPVRCCSQHIGFIYLYTVSLLVCCRNSVVEIQDQHTGHYVERTRAKWKAIIFKGVRFLSNELGCLGSFS